MAKLNKVLYNIDQTGDTSAAEKRTARNNIGCPSIITSTNTLPPVETDINTLTFKTDSRVYADNNIIGNIAPNPGQTDAGKFLVAQWAGSPAIGTYALAAVNQVPASTISNSGQALIVDPSGNPVWSTFNTVPASTVADKTKVLTVNDQGIAEWAPSSTSITPYFQVVNVSLSGGNMQWPNTVPITGTSIPAGKTFVGTITLSSFETNFTSLVNIDVFGGNTNVELSNFYRGGEVGGALCNTFTIPVKHVNSSNVAEPLEFGLNGSVDAQTLKVIVQGITY